MVKKTKRSASKPSKEAMAAAEQMLAPLHDLLKASVAQNEMQAEMLTDLRDRIEKLAGQLDNLQKAVALELPPAKLLTEPSPAPGETDSKLLQEFAHEGGDRS